VFFGESLPPRFFELQREDFACCDLLLVMGTSLQVQPFAGLVDKPLPRCPRVLLNRQAVGEASSSFGNGFHFTSGEGGRDVFIQGDCDAGVLELCKHLGWEAELKELSR